jgi:hypothetical protein
VASLQHMYNKLCVPVCHCCLRTVGSLRTRIGQEVGNGPNIDWQGQIHRGILRGLRNISETP